MKPAQPEVLQQLASAADAEAREQAWSAFLHAHSDLLLHVARELGGDQDRVMDRYAFVLDALRRDDFRRLRGYPADGRGRFTTWLIVVARRLCLDEHRHRYGRPQGTEPAGDTEHRGRRRLVDLVGDELGVALLEAPAGAGPDAQLGHRELGRALNEALESLDPEDRLLLRLRFEDGVSVPEIARAFGEDSPFRLYRRLDKTLNTLRRHLEAAGVNDSRS